MQMAQTHKVPRPSMLTPSKAVPGTNCAKVRRKTRSEPNLPRPQVSKHHDPISTIKDSLGLCTAILARWVVSLLQVRLSGKPKPLLSIWIPRSITGDVLRQVLWARWSWWNGNRVNWPLRHLMSRPMRRENQIPILLACLPRPSLQPLRLFRGTETLQRTGSLWQILVSPPSHRRCATLCCPKALSTVMLVDISHFPCRA